MDINSQILIKPLYKKSIVWFKNTNTYVLVAPETALIILQFFKGYSETKLLSFIENQLDVSNVEANTLLKSILKLIKKLNSKNDIRNDDKTDLKPNTSPKIVKYYQIKNTCFRVAFQTKKLAFLIHPKFAHLEVVPTHDLHHYFEVFLRAGKIVFIADGDYVGTWSADEIHFFQGKFSMKLIEKLYQKPEADWMGVFHASALSNGKQNIMFLGDSGNGKSTLAALLAAQSYTLFADDFVPVEANSHHIYYFPAAISIKQKALEVLEPLFPILKKTPQINLMTYIDKSVRYLVTPPLKEKTVFHLPCKVLVFVKYQKDSGLKIKEITKENAFQKLIPDSWLSPLPQNAYQFLDWFEKLTCYNLTYSDNELMYQTVKKLYKDDL